MVYAFSGEKNHVLFGGNVFDGLGVWGGGIAPNLPIKLNGYFLRQLNSLRILLNISILILQQFRVCVDLIMESFVDG
jgi:hypothetical protein